MFCRTQNSVNSIYAESGLAPRLNPQHFLLPSFLLHPFSTKMSASPPPAPPPRSPSPPLSPSDLYLCVPCNTTFPTLLAAVTHRLETPSHSASLPTRTTLAPVVLLSLVQHPDIVTLSVHSPVETRRRKEDDLTRILIDQVTAALRSSSIRSAIKNIVTTPKRPSEYSLQGRSKVLKLTRQNVSPAALPPAARYPAR